MRSLLYAQALHINNKLLATILSALLFTAHIAAQDKNQKVFTQDIDNFWIAYDSIRSSRDSLQQIQFINSLYIDKGTEGLKAFMALRDYTAEKWVSLINRSPKFWNSIRPNTLTVKEKAAMIESSIRKFKELYPQLGDAKIYFTVGGLNSGGTTMRNLILIGSEIATGTASTDLSDLPEGMSKWLGGVFKEQSLDNITSLNIHEYVHTQQRGDPGTLLGQSIKEGSCDFITELVIGKALQNNYIQYGRLHEKELAEKFKYDMFTTHYNNWLYNGSTAKTVADLGYFMGYAICKSYYNNARNKKKATREIIELNYADTTAVENFLARSKFYNESLDKAALRSKFESQRPYIVSIEPLTKSDSIVKAEVKEMKIVFSTAMDGSGVSISRGTKGKETYPIVGVSGFSEDKTTYTLKVNLQPGKEYEFIITDLGFKSAAGYPVKQYHVRFRTAPE